MESFKPKLYERAALRSAIAALGRGGSAVVAPKIPSSGPLMGYRVKFMEPPTFRIDVGRFGVLYRFDASTIRVGSIAVY